MYAQVADDGRVEHRQLLDIFFGYGWQTAAQHHLEAHVETVFEERSACMADLEVAILFLAFDLSGRSSGAVDLRGGR